MKSVSLYCERILLDSLTLATTMQKSNEKYNRLHFRAKHVILMQQGSENEPRRLFSIFLQSIDCQSGADCVITGQVGRVSQDGASGGGALVEKHNFYSRRGWINDPNGLVYHDGCFHMFFQHHPDSNTWGPMHWGHATSPDLIHWSEQDIAMGPDQLGCIFSGSIVVDHENRFGLASDKHPAWIAFFTHHDSDKYDREDLDCEYQSAAFSLDKGMSWTKFEGNPVLPNPGQLRDFRDPFVFWHADSAAWIMVLSAGDRIQFYRSTTLTGWTLSGEFSTTVEEGSVWECPILCELPIEDTDESRWVLFQSFNPGGRYGGSGTRYFLGSFDGFEFSVTEQSQHHEQQSEAMWIDWGPDYYAMNVWANPPHPQTGPIAIGWMSNWAYAKHTYEAPFRGSMSNPRRLSLRKLADRYYVRSRPAFELDTKPISRVNSKVEVDLNETSLSAVEIQCPADEMHHAKIQLMSEGQLIASIQLNPNPDSWIVRRENSRPAESEDLSSGVFAFPRLVDSQSILVEILISQRGVELFFDDGMQTATLLLDQRKTVDLVAVRWD